MSGLSLLGGISAYTRFNSVPSLVAGMGIGSMMALSGMRIKDGMNGGLECAAGELGVLILYPCVVHGGPQR